jgi:hypothetical protein
MHYGLSNCTNPLTSSATKQKKKHNLGFPNWRGAGVPQLGISLSHHTKRNYMEGLDVPMVSVSEQSSYDELMLDSSFNSRATLETWVDSKLW